ncbi:class I SAM-dependent methyltransferase [Kutzneria viridogrisea]|uniref:Transferase n=2 Tax=Kutzneria TaxID=43356 RepID=W5WUF7_9PSEU|nr:methyltransferase domain-containing protein [Kutzneria albida]AHI01785.1 hypothetical protein KALB_8428 [Kutzneria albida DSM 43870]MBA8931748.1 hypothetical protein [Kutzneria viridogrisea]
MLSHGCRACHGTRGELVLDLGRQPACDAFPLAVDQGPDPVHPLRMWLCADCGLAQLVEDPTTPDEPRGVEPAALVAQAEDAVRRVAAAGLLGAGRTVAEYGSPHGGTWLPMLTGHGLVEVADGEPADVVLDCFGLMHHADQAAAIAERAARLTSGGVLLVQYHSLATIIRSGQWNALRHGHFAYYSTPALISMLTSAGLVARSAWRFDLYGGTVLLAAGVGGTPDTSVTDLMAEEIEVGVLDAEVVAGLQRTAHRSAGELRRWLETTDRRPVVGYGAASRAVALLCRAGVDADLLPAVADAAPGKWGRRMPGTAIPVISPAELVEADPAAVLLFLPDLIDEVRDSFPTLADRWVVAEPVPTIPYPPRSVPEEAR